MTVAFTCRELSEAVGILLHTIICERKVYDELYARPTKRLGIRYPMCWEEVAETYICKIEQHIRSFMRVQDTLQMHLAIFRPWPYTYEAIESWTFLLSSPNDGLDQRSMTDLRADIQATVDQIRASASFLPELEPGNVFKVTFYADAELKPSAHKFSIGEEIQTNSAVDGLAFRPIHGEYSLELEMNASRST